MKNKRRSKLTVRYRLNGRVIDEVRNGYRFRWTPAAPGAWDIIEERSPGVDIWHKVYTDVITLELKIRWEDRHR